MKILRLDLTAFGSFTDRSLDLAAGREGLHLIFGPNEAGKSTALRALRQLLYGIPVRSTDNFIHENRKMRIGARLRGRDGLVMDCIRRKGNKDTLVRPDESPIDESEMNALLGGVDETTFETMFGISHETLVKGGDAILAGNGELGRILFAAGAGIADLRGIQMDLEVEADKLFLPNGKKPTINAAIIELEQKRKEIEKKQLASSDWAQHDEALQKATAEKQQVEVHLATLLREKGRLERIRDVLPVIAGRATRREAPAGCADAVLLPENFGDRRRDASARLKPADDAERQAREALAVLDGELASLGEAVAAPLLAETQTLQQMQERLGSHKKALEDRKRLLGELLQHEADARTVLQGLRPDLELEHAGQLQVPEEHRRTLRDLGMRHAGLLQAAEATTQQRDTVHQKQKAAATRLAEMEPERDASALQQALHAVRAAGPIEPQRAKLREECATEAAGIETDLRALPLWSGSLEELERLAIPDVETVERYALDHAALARDLRSARQRLDEAAGEQTERVRQIEEFDREQPVPAESDLETLRGRRDALWQQVRDAWHAGQPDNGMGQDFEHALRAADELVDRLRSEAERISTRARLEAECQRAAEKQAQRQAELNEAEAASRAADDTWQALWQPTGLTPSWTDKMPDWLRRRDKLISRSRGHREKQSRLAELDQAVQTHRDTLSGTLTALTEPPADATESLPKLLERAQQVAARIDSARDTRRRLNEELARHSADIPGAEQAATRAQEELTHWGERWAEAIGPLGLSAAATPQEAAAFLERTTSLFRTLETVQSHRQRIAGIDADAVQFTQDLRLLAQRLAPDLADQPPEALVGTLRTRHDAARTASERRDTLLVQRARVEKNRADALAARAAAEGELAKLRDEAGCADNDGLLRAEERSAQRRRLESEIAQLEQRILERSAGAALEAFIHEAQAVDADALPPRLASLEQQATAAEQQRSTLDNRIGGEQTLLDQMNGSAEAAELAEQRQQLLAQVAGQAMEFTRFKVAAKLLRDGIERYRRKNQAPIMARASALFAALTCGAYQGLDIDSAEDKKPFLVGIPADGQKSRTVTAMSDGTRDQLYLALRLASLETFLERNVPVPFIVDDVLVHFDDDRSRAVLKVLAEFSQKTQVIFFTHHEHLVRMAEGCLPVDVLFVHRLGGSPISAGVQIG